jgi:glycosyltransferase involved in cell wall biosynthesis
VKIGCLMQAGVPDIRQRPLSGPAIHVTEVFGELQAMGHTVRLVVLLDNQIMVADNLDRLTAVPPLSLSRGLPRLIESGVRRVQSTFKLPYATWFESRRFAEACRHFLADYDLLYERMGWFGYGGSLAADQMGKPHVLEVNGDHLSELAALGMAPKGLQRYLSVSLMRRAVGRAAHVVTAGEGWRQQFLARWPVPSQRVTSIENGTQLVNLLPCDALANFREATDSELTIAYVGAFDPWQGLDILLRAFAQALQQGIQARLLLIGSGREEGALVQLVSDLAIGEQVAFLGQLPLVQVAQHLATASIGVSSYCGRSEMSGLKLLDYKAAGLAILASGSHGQPTVLAQEVTALIVPPCDEAALADGIVRLCANPALRRQLGQTARHEAETQHRWRHTAEKLTHLFEQLV